MASANAKQQQRDSQPVTPGTPRTAPGGATPIGGELTITASPDDWKDVLRGLTIAGGECAMQRNYQDMYEFHRLAAQIAQVLGLNPVTAAGAFVERAFAAGA